MEYRVPTKEFIRAWYEWQHTPEPVSNFRRRRAGAPTYQIECDLDHLASSIYSLGSGVIGRASWDPGELASEQIRELERIGSELDGCAISDTEKGRFTNYLSVTRALLQELMKLGGGDEKVPSHPTEGTG